MPLLLAPGCYAVWAEDDGVLLSAYELFTVVDEDVQLLLSTPVTDDCGCL